MLGVTLFPLDQAPSAKANLSTILVEVAYRGVFSLSLCWVAGPASCMSQKQNLLFSSLVTAHTAFDQSRHHHLFPPSSCPRRLSSMIIIVAARLPRPLPSSSRLVCCPPRKATSNGKKSCLCLRMTLLLGSGTYSKFLVSNHRCLHVLLRQSGTADGIHFPLKNCSFLFFFSQISNNQHQVTFEGEICVKVGDKRFKFCFKKRGEGGIFWIVEPGIPL